MLLLDTMSCLSHIGHQRIMRGSDEPGHSGQKVGQKGPRARVLVSLFLLAHSLYLSLSLSLCTSLVVPQRQQTRRLAVVSRFTPYFWYYFCCSYFGSAGYMGPFWLFPLLVLSHYKSRCGTVMSGVKDSA